MSAPARVRLADLQRCAGAPSDAWLTAAAAVHGSLQRTGAIVLELDGDEPEALDELLTGAAEFFAQPAVEKRLFAADSDARGAPGYRALRSQEHFDLRPNDSKRAPDALERAGPRAYAQFAAAGRAVLAALSWRLSQEGHLTNLAALCEPAELPSGEQGASVLTVFRYRAGTAEPANGGAAPHVDGGLLTLVACRLAGLEIQDSSASAGLAWLPLPLEAGELAVLAGATLAEATAGAVQACTHRVVAQATARLSAVLRLRGAPDAPLGATTVAAFEAAFASSHASVNRAEADAPGAKKAKLSKEDKARIAEAAQRRRLLQDAKNIERRRREDEKRRLRVSKCD